MTLPDVITLHNGEKVEGTFSRGEMDRRVSKLRALLTFFRSVEPNSACASVVLPAAMYISASSDRIRWLLGAFSSRFVVDSISDVSRPELANVCRAARRRAWFCVVY